MAEMVSQVCKSPCIENDISGEFNLVSARDIGKDVAFCLSITNLTIDPKTVNVEIRACSILYTKKEINELLKESKKIHLKDCEVQEVPVIITYAQYEGLLTADNAIEVTAICSCDPFKGAVIIQTNIVLNNPKFQIKLKEKASINKPVDAEIVFTNPLNEEVSDIVVTVEGSGLLKEPMTIRGGSVKPNETTTIPLTITPYKAGTKHLLADFTSNKFKNAKGYLEIIVHETE